MAGLYILGLITGDDRCFAITCSQEKKDVRIGKLGGALPIPVYDHQRHIMKVVAITEVK